MSDDKARSQKPAPQSQKATTPAAPLKGQPAAPIQRPPLFRRVDWLAFGITTFLVFLGYYLTLAPDLTLEDSGELATGSFYAAVPHPPGYPVWTLYTWLFTVLFPVSNIAYRVAMSSAVAGAFGCGLLALVTTRGSSMMLEGINGLMKMERKWEDRFCAVSGMVAGTLLGFNGFLWSQAVIVEVYPISVLSFMAVLTCLLQWVYAPDKKRYLYAAFFLFGICFTNHQTLIVAAMGIEVLVLAIQPQLGRDLFLANSIVYATGLFLKANGMMGAFDNNIPLFIIYNAVGVGSMLTCGWMSVKTTKVATEFKTVVFLGFFWILGSMPYFYMPLASMTNPPMNWGYPRTWDGFIHAFTRGQYEKTNPTSDPGRLFSQLQMYFEGAVEEFNFVYLLIAIVPLLFYKRMQKRERGWMVGLLAIYACLALLLMILLNPSPDRQSRGLTRVFFTASHVIISMGIGYGLALIAGLMATSYERSRSLGLYGGAVSLAVAVYGFIQLDKLQPIFRQCAMFGILLAAAITVAFWVSRKKAPLMAMLIIFSLMPGYSMMAHWWDNEQRGHLFGFWFGHDMFTPPFNVYPAMSRDAILYGGTDPGRFCPTYMVFCESFTPPEKRRDPKFDRRDVYVITQNALADNTYMNYIRAHYNRSKQIDPPFFQEMFRSRRSVDLGTTNLLARMVGPLDHFFTNLGKNIEDRRRKEGVYPKKEMYIATTEDSQRCFTDYIADAQKRLANGQLKPGEDVKVVDNRVQVTGQVAVMAINGLLTKVMFDANPDHEFYVEESFPLEWMYPHLTPFGIIMKINRNPVSEFTDDIIKKDHEFWSKYSERLTGNIISYETPVKEICEFAERVYLHGDFSKFKGDPAFVRDDNGQKAFSKLRSSIAGIYTWRINNSKTSEEQQRMIKEADFAFRQAFSYCPYSPEAVFRYCNLLASIGRIDDAITIATTAQKFDLDNASVLQLLDQLKQMKNAGANPAQFKQAVGGLEQKYRANPDDAQTAFQLASAYIQTGRTNAAVQIMDSLMSKDKVDVSVILAVATAYVQLGQPAKLEATLQKLVQLVPDNPEGWYDLAAIQVTVGKQAEGLAALAKSAELSRARLLKQPGSKDLVTEAQKDPRFVPLQNLPEYKRIFAPK